MHKQLIDKLKSQTPLQTYQALKFIAGEIPLFLPPTQESLIPAAVLVPIINHPHHPTLLLTRRTDHLHHHAGQISFPGGKFNKGEDPLQCALRETQEEIGLASHSIEIISTLGSWPSFSGFLIYPIMGIIQPPMALSPCSAEVEEIFEIPLDNAFNPELYTRIDNTSPIPHHYFEMVFEQKRIWGFTAGLMMLLGAYTRRLACSKVIDS